MQHEPARLALAALVGACVTYFVSEWTRIRRKKRLIVEAAQVPSFTLTIKGGQVRVQMFGNYSVINLSDLPVNLGFLHVSVYNVASRGFQLYIGRDIPFDKWFEETVIEPNTELILLSSKTSSLTIDRFWLRSLPGFLWLETLAFIRIGSRKVFRNRARLYRLSYWPKERGEAWYTDTGFEVRSALARALTLPGKWRHRFRERQHAKNGGDRKEA